MSSRGVEHVSGASRLCQSMVMAVCVSPLLFLAGVGLLGWNEKEAVCNARAIEAGEDGVAQVGCHDVGSHKGDLVMFSCPLSASQLLVATGASRSKIVGTAVVGYTTVTEMFLCIETSSKTEKKSHTGGGGKEIITTVSYHLDWTPTWVDSSKFADRQAAKRECKGLNAATSPDDLSHPKTMMADDIKAGSFKLNNALTSRIPLTFDAKLEDTPEGWAQSGGWYTKKKSASAGQDAIGDLRMKFRTNNQHDHSVTVLGANGGATGGMMESWKAPSSWLCSGERLSELFPGTRNKDEVFVSLSSSLSARTWIFRIVGFVCLWIALMLLVAPLGVMADCIPCVGPFLGDAFEAIACCVSCLPATACCLLVVGIVWTAMRPLVGGSMMLVALILFGGMAYMKANRQASYPAARELELGLQKW